MDSKFQEDGGFLLNTIKTSVTAGMLRDKIKYLLYIGYHNQTLDWRHDLEQHVR